MKSTLSESHQIGKGDLDKLVTPVITRDWRSDYRIRDAIDEGKELGAELDDESIKKLDQDYFKYLNKTPVPKTITPSISIKEVTPWSQHRSFTSIISVDEFFTDSDKLYSALKDHQLEQSPCYLILGIRHVDGVKYDTIYYCELCQPEHVNDSKVTSIHLSVLEHHCKYRDPERHKAEILARLKSREVNI